MTYGEGGQTTCTVLALRAASFREISVMLKDQKDRVKSNSVYSAKCCCYDEELRAREKRSTSPSAPCSDLQCLVICMFHT